MSDVTIQLSDKRNLSDTRVEPSSSALPTWWLVFTRELAELWIGGKALSLILVYGVFLGAVTYVIASSSELSLIPPKETVYETLKNAIAVSMFIGLIIGADSLSGERERATLETLLLTPASRRQIVVGKFLAGISPWPAALLIAIPYLSLLSQGDEILWPAIFWGGVLGSALAPAYVGLGMLVSFLSNTNKTSYFLSLGIYILFLVPAQLPGRAQTGVAGQFLQWANPVAATNHFLSKYLVNYGTLAQWWTWLISPVVFAVLVLGLLFLYASPGLRLEGGRASKLWSRLARVAGLSVMACFMAVSLSAPPATAFQEKQSAAENLQISIDMEYAEVKTGDNVKFNTLVTNNGAQTSRRLIVAINIINLKAMEKEHSLAVVDPEDWSPLRTQYLDPLAPGQSASQAWIINTIWDGDYMVYIVVMPAPEGPEATSRPVASSAVHLTVTPFTRLNPRHVLPLVIGVPLFLILSTALLLRRRRRAIDAGGSS